MRNLGTRFNMSNVLTLAGGSTVELAKALTVLTLAMGANSRPEFRTPSEVRVLQGLTDWYVGNADEDITFRVSPAYAYVNLNTGINLLFLFNNAYDPVCGVEIGLISDEGCKIVSDTLVPDDFD